MIDTNSLVDKITNSIVGLDRQQILELSDMLKEFSNQARKFKLTRTSKEFKEFVILYAKSLTELIRFSEGAKDNVGNHNRDVYSQRTTDSFQSSNHQN